MRGRYNTPVRPLLVMVSDIHLTDQLRAGAVSRAAQFERFWIRIQAARGDRPAELCFVGDLFDLVRSPRWLEGDARPYHDPEDRQVRATVGAIVDAILEREADFFAAIRKRVESGELVLQYLAGNHDRLLRHAPAARRAVSRALTGGDALQLESEREFPHHGVLAFHGHICDPINFHPDGDATIGDAIGIELILRFPHAVRALAGEDHPGLEILDDVDDVRPVYAVPAWVRQVGGVRKELLRPVGKVWGDLVEEFLDNDFVSRWLRDRRRAFAFDVGKKLRLLLALSKSRIMARAHDEKMTRLYRLLQLAFDGKMSAHGAGALVERTGLRYVVNGHSHFASMRPLGSLAGRPAVYFNTGTWRTVHQIGHDVGGRPSFLPYDAMSYLVFFPEGDPMGRDFEWWTGALVTAV